MDRSFSEIRAVLITTPDRWQRLALALPDDLLRRKPRPGDWSALECLSHLLDTEAVLNFRVQCFLAGEAFPAFNPDTERSKAFEQPGKDLAVELGRLRQESLKVLDTLSEADLDRRARHAELGLVTLRQMLNEWAAHDLLHTIQAERALMQPFIDECGPWQIYFIDHWVGAPQ